MRIPEETTPSISGLPWPEKQSILDALPVELEKSVPVQVTPDTFDDFQKRLQEFQRQKSELLAGCDDFQEDEIHIVFSIVDQLQNVMAVLNEGLRFVRTGLRSSAEESEQNAEAARKKLSTANKMLARMSEDVYGRQYKPMLDRLAAHIENIWGKNTSDLRMFLLSKAARKTLRSITILRPV